jgi:hypothetical protein
MSFPTRRVVALSRTLHIYLTVFALFAIAIFALTGICLNHSELFGLDAARSVTTSGQLPPALLQSLDKLDIVEYLRSHMNARGAVGSYSTDDDEIRISFRAPARKTDISIRRPGGAIDMLCETRGLLAALGDLHRGDSTGAAWKWVLDATAGAILLGTLTGIILLLTTPRRRLTGLAALGAGTAIMLAAYWFLVP